MKKKATKKTYKLKLILITLTKQFEAYQACPAVENCSIHHSSAKIYVTVIKRKKLGALQ